MLALLRAWTAMWKSCIKHLSKEHIHAYNQILYLSISMQCATPPYLHLKHFSVVPAAYGHPLGMESWDIMESQVSVGRPQEVYRPGWRARLHDDTIVGQEQPYWRALASNDWIEVIRIHNIYNMDTLAANSNCNERMLATIV